MEGYNFWWHENGKLKKISFYKTGVIQGKVEWEESGTLKEKRGIFENATAEEIKQMQKLKVNEIELSKFVSKFLK
jgi:antitoxin component YwqK of YwqJK toxin-antitoxin module